MSGTVTAARSAQMQAIIDMIPADFASPTADYREVRQTMAPFHSQAVSEELVTTFSDFGGVRCGRYRLPGSSERVLLHCHGGAFVSCPLDHYHFYAEIIASQLASEVVMPDYRLAPEHVFPAAHEDCFNAYRGLLNSGVSADNIVLLGESCGGSLALGILLQARAAGVALPAGFVSLTGWFDLSVSGVEVGGDDPFLTPQWVRNRGRDYTAGTIELNDPALSPAFADLRGLPPLYLQVGEMDTVREGALLLAANATRCGVAVTLEHWPGAIQGWHGLINAGVPEAEQAWGNIKSWLQQLERD